MRIGCTSKRAPIGQCVFPSSDDSAEVFQPNGAGFLEVARRVAALIEAPVEYVGIGAVPGCAGKWIVDLLLSYPLGKLAAMRDALGDLGFQ